ncbi:transglutaminase family protein [Nocardioides sp. TRM66260-LWL]|uniref:transglutaminase family protein n=1 Tax=Nocardioides sp. TRM66260-LWL TaxID=2874478 RepID=UPI001CC6ACC0|nr:transglutaminase family protein [Nocardioides sp. TRM66260-LWL]MBZ5735979.1 transglutaminase family protein [Nocardioides sp. TRM66260-LWL]
MRRYRVTHRTAYGYDDDVTDSYGVAYLTPRSLPWQEVRAARVEVAPVPADARDDVDCYGNTTTWFQVTTPHRRLVIDAVSEVDVAELEHDAAALAMPWERARPLVHPDLPDAWEVTDFALPSGLAEPTRGAAAYGAQSLTRRRPLGEAVLDLMHRIHRDFEYDKTATTVTSTVADTLEKRAGVCQDFAHLTLACLRAHGLAARYVSGYLATDPPPGRERIVGADASHAWVAVWLPLSGGWLAIDPTNDQVAGERYVTLAWGRDYGDVPPVKGVIFTEATTSTLRVSVDVAPLEVSAG